MDKKQFRNKCPDPDAGDISGMGRSVRLIGAGA
jgi:hypothetical protein